jgi:hypothetical protein
VLGGQVPYVIVVFTDALIFIRSSLGLPIAGFALRIAGAFVEADQPAEQLAKRLGKIIGTDSQYQLARQRANIDYPLISSADFLSGLEGAYSIPTGEIVESDVVDAGAEVHLHLRAATHQARWLGKGSQWRIEKGDERIAHAVVGTLGCKPPDDVHVDVATGTLEVPLWPPEHDISAAITTNAEGRESIDLETVAAMLLQEGNVLNASDVYGMLGATSGVDHLPEEKVSDVLTSLANQGSLLAQLGRDRECVTALQQLLDLAEKHTSYLAVTIQWAFAIVWQALCLARLGENELAVARLDQLIDGVYPQASEKQRDLALVPMAPLSGDQSLTDSQAHMRKYSLSEVCADALVHKSILLWEHPKENRDRLFADWQTARDVFGASTLADVQVSVAKCIVHEACFHELERDRATASHRFDEASDRLRSFASENPEAQALLDAIDSVRRSH